MTKSTKRCKPAAPKPFTVAGGIELFPVDSPWAYVRVPKAITIETMDRAERGLVAIAATLGATTWNTSLMPMGDGTQFIPLPRKVRKAERCEIGDAITVSFVLRSR